MPPRPHLLLALSPLGAAPAAANPCLDPTPSVWPPGPRPGVCLTARPFRLMHVEVDRSCAWSRFGGQMTSDQGYLFTAKIRRNTQALNLIPIFICATCPPQSPETINTLTFPKPRRISIGRSVSLCRSFPIALSLCFSARKGKRMSVKRAISLCY